MGDYTIKEFEHAGLTVKIEAEQYLEEWMNPRADVDGILGVMVTEYRGYTFGGGKNDQNGVPDTEIDCPMCDATGELEGAWEIQRVAAFGYEVVLDGFSSEDVAEAQIGDLTNEETTDRLRVEHMTCPRCEGSTTVELSLKDWVRHQGARVCLPLFVYEHSGITMSAGRNMLTGEDDLNRHGRYAQDPGDWDTSSVGIYFDTTETREECGWEERSVKEIEEDLKGEINAYDAYLRGDVRLYVVENEDGEVLESCGGFLISTDEDERYMLVEAKAAAESAREDIEKEKREAADWAARDTVTVNG